MNDSPIFESVWDALHFSFYMEVIPAGTVSPTWTAIKVMMKNSGRVRDRVESRIKMTGLSQLEVRGQCAMVRGMVEHHLTTPEKCAVWARHGVDVTESRGIKGLAEYLERVTVNNGECLQMIVGSLYSKDGSTRAIAETFEMSRTTVLDDKRRAQSAIQVLEDMAIRRLEPLFQKDGLIFYEENFIIA